MRFWLGRGLALLAAAAMFVASPTARADVVSDQPGAILVVPKILVDSLQHLDTLIQITNESNTPINLQCFYVNATPTCTTNPSFNCITDQHFTSSPREDCLPATACQQQWQETDFRVVLTKNQPVAWLASHGAVDCLRTESPPDNDPLNNLPCFPLDGTFRIGEGGQSNAGSNVPPVGQDPFIGELKCVAVDENDVPVARNDVHGHITISDEGDISGYNIISIRALDENNGDNTLVLGRPGDEGVEYNGCPNILILDHFFDFATDPTTSLAVTTDLTLVPCSEDFSRQETFATTVQFLVFNEFEQRFSTSRRVECFRTIQISNIDTATNERSIFSAFVAGTLTGQTRIRGVVGSNPDFGNTLIGMAEEYRTVAGVRGRIISTAAFNIHAQGVRPQKDFIYLP